MLPRCCYKPMPLQKTISGTAAVLFLIAAPALRAANDKAPPWLHAAAEMPIPEHEPDAVAVVLQDDTEITVRDNGDIQTLRRRAFRILRPEARTDYGSVAVPFDADTKVLSMAAWTITKDGAELRVKEKDAVEHQFLDDIEYTDEKKKALRFPEAVPGSVIGYEYVQKDRPYTFEDTWNFQDFIPVKQARLRLSLPAGWEYSARWFNHPEQEPQSANGGEFIWQVDNLPALREEEEMPPPRAVAGWMGLKYFPRDPAMRSKSVGSWMDIGLWYNGLAQSRRDSTPAIRQRVAELTGNISDPVAKIRALTEYVQRNIHYFAVEIGIGGYQPHPAGEIFAHQYGDCKDKATLLSTMLSEIKVESYYILVDAYRDGVYPDYPSMNFNHMILAIKVPPGVDASGIPSLVDDRQLGKLLIFDPTNEYVPFGYLPSYLQSTYGLAMGPSGGVLVGLPLSGPSTNRVVRTARFSLNPLGDLAGEVNEVSWGAPAHVSRGRYNSTQPSKRAEILERSLQISFRSFILNQWSAENLEKYDENFALKYTFHSPGYARRAGNELLVRPSALSDEYIQLLELFSQEKPREYPIELEWEGTQSDVFEIALPPGYELDGDVPAVSASCDFATYSSKVGVQSGTLHYSRTLQIQAVHVPKEKLAELRDFLQKVADDEQTYVALRRVTQTTVVQ